MEIQIRIKKIENVKFSINDLSKEVFGMYQGTLGNISKDNLQLFIVSFFILIKVNKKSLLTLLIENNINTLNSFIQEINSKKYYLKKGEYNKLKKKYNLEKLLDNDIFLLCLEVIKNFHEFDQYSIPKFLFKKENLDEINYINQTYSSFLNDISEFYSSNKIEDYREDINGNRNDLSKKLSHMIKMRQSKKLIIGLEKFTKINYIGSNSPIDFSFIQYINPDYFISLWQSFHLFDFLSSNFDVNQLLTNIPKIDFDNKFSIGDLIALIALLEQRRQGKLSKKEIQKLNSDKVILENKLKETEESKEIIDNLSEKIINTKEHIGRKISYLEGKAEALSKYKQTKKIKEDLKAIDKELKFLKNLEIEINNH